jgi:hypothetical protein
MLSHQLVFMISGRALDKVWLVYARGAPLRSQNFVLTLNLSQEHNGVRNLYLRARSFCLAVLARADVFLLPGMMTVGLQECPGCEQMSPVVELR